MMEDDPMIQTPWGGKRWSFLKRCMEQYNLHDELVESLQTLVDALFETGLASLPGDAAFDVRRACDDALIVISKSKGVVTE